MNEETAERAAGALSAMANPTRLSILMFLASQESPVSAIASHVGMSCSSTSQHLAKLRAQGLVTTRKAHQMVYYSCQSASVRALLEVLEEVLHMQ